MRRSKWRWIALLIVVVAALGGWAHKPTTTLELTAHGGFVYVPTKHGLEIGFMKSVHLDTDGNATQDPNTCSVKQLGVELRIDDGRIVDPPPSTTSTIIDVTKKIIDVTDMKIRFDGMGSGGVALEGGLSTPASMTSPAKPSYREDDAGWKDMYWVPRTNYHDPNARLATNWRSHLSGRVLLRGGTLRGGMPSEGAAVNGTFDFTAASSATTTPAVSQALTDRTKYSTVIRGSQVVIHLNALKLVIEPIDSRKTVGLILTGRHAPAGHPMQDGDRMTDFCAFYELLQNPPPMKDRLIPQFAQSVSPVSSQAGRPSPGLFCSGTTAQP